MLRIISKELFILICSNNLDRLNLNDGYCGCRWTQQSGWTRNRLKKCTLYNNNNAIKSRLGSAQRIKHSLLAIKDHTKDYIHDVKPFKSESP